MKHVRAGLAGLLAAALVIRTVAWLLEPVVPLLVVMFLMASLMYWIVHGR
ncbi:MAG: hypothetical protein LC808_32650 [Actinobacteria bacterium]|nr:hypothetical protein [Actinomycetota bacterium]